MSLYSSYRRVQDAPPPSVPICKDPNVPKIAHFYWGNPEKMPYLRYLTLETFAKFNPDWKMKLYIPTQVVTTQTWKSHEQRYDVGGKNFFPEVSKLPVEIIPMNCATFGVSNDISEVHKSDLLRWHLLYVHGGLWSDMDIIYFKPMPKLTSPVGVSLNARYGHSIGLLFACPDNQVFSHISCNALTGFKPDGYQSAGVSILNRLFPTMDHIDGYFPQYKAMNIPMDWVYAYDAKHIPEIFQANAPERFTDDSIGIHWYAGSPLAAGAVNCMSPQNYHMFNHTLGKSVVRALQKEQA